LRERQEKAIRILEAEVPGIPWLVLRLSGQLSAVAAGPIGDIVDPTLKNRERQADPDSLRLGDLIGLAPKEQVRVPGPAQMNQ